MCIFFSESTVCPTGCLCYRGRPVCGFESTVAIGSTELVPPYATGISIIVPYTNGEFRSVGLFSMCCSSFLSLDVFSDATMCCSSFLSLDVFSDSSPSTCSVMLPCWFVDLTHSPHSLTIPLCFLLELYLILGGLVLLCFIVLIFCFCRNKSN